MFEKHVERWRALGPRAAMRYYVGTALLERAGGARLRVLARGDLELRARQPQALLGRAALLHPARPARPRPLPARVALLRGDPPAHRPDHADHDRELDLEHLVGARHREGG